MTLTFLVPQIPSQFTHQHRKVTTMPPSSTTTYGLSDEDHRRILEDREYDSFDHASEKYDVLYENYNPHPFSHAHRRQDVDRFLSYADVQANMEVLELGFGDGQLLLAVKRRVGNSLVVGIDASQKALDRMRPYSQQLQSPIHLHRLDFTAASLSEQLAGPQGPTLFDRILAQEVWNGIAVGDRAYVIQQWQRLLRPGGQIVFSAEGLFQDTALVYCPGERPVRVCDARSWEVAFRDVQDSLARLQITPTRLGDAYDNDDRIVQDKWPELRLLCQQLWDRQHPAQPPGSAMHPTFIELRRRDMVVPSVMGLQRQGIPAICVNAAVLVRVGHQ